MSAKKNIDWDNVDGIDDAKVSLRSIAKRVGCSHAAVEQARGKRARLEEENANLRRVLQCMVDVFDNELVPQMAFGPGHVAQVLIDEARKVLRG